MKLKFLVAAATVSFASSAFAQTVVNTAPVDGFRYGSGNDYTPANAIVSTTTANELALRFHKGNPGALQAPASDANGVYSFALGTSPLSYDFSIDGSAENATIALTNLLTGNTVTYNPFFAGNDNATTCPQCAAFGQTQNSARLNFFFLGNQLNTLGYNPNQDNTFRAVLSASGNSVTAFARIGAGAPAVPEPATWAMMLVGFGGMGVAMRRNRRKSATALQVA
jgi:opacity protein-like surface antigen